MNPAETEVLSKVIEKTNSELILFFVIIGVIFIFAVIMIFRPILKDRKEKRNFDKEHNVKLLEMENDRILRAERRDERIIEVITANTHVISDFRTALKANIVDIKESIKRVHDRIDDQNKLLSDQGKTLTFISVKIGETVSINDKNREGENINDPIT